MDTGWSVSIPGGQQSNLDNLASMLWQSRSFSSQISNLKEAAIADIGRYLLLVDRFMQLQVKDDRERVIVVHPSCPVHGG